MPSAHEIALTAMLLPLRCARLPIMVTRKLRTVKPPLPAIGICEACNSSFRSSKRSQEEAEKEIKAAFDDRSAS
jgi:hypothetical protein